jgi:hypothetical protein
VFSHGSKGRLTTRDLGRFPGASLFDAIGRAVSAAGCVPRKELYEAWEVARRARRRFRGGRVLDMAGGHGLLAHVMLLLDDASPAAVVVDRDIPKSAAAVHAALVARWPRLSSRVAFVTADLGDAGAVPIDATDELVSAHACGALTDTILDRAIGARARVAVLPCCHDARANDTGALEGWMDAALAIDATRAARLRTAAYRVWTQTIPAEITPRNRLLIGEPSPPHREL